MNIIQREKDKMEVEGATVDFFTFNEGDETYYYFDTTKCGPPEPMVNAMTGLQLLKSDKEVLIMHNHKKPMGLLEKVSKNYDITEEMQDDGTIMLFFRRNAPSDQADLSDKSCH